MVNLVPPPESPRGGYLVPERRLTSVAHNLYSAAQVEGSKEKKLCRYLTAELCPKIGEMLGVTESKSDTRNALAEYLQTLHWDAFFTATFAQHQRYSSSAIGRVVSRLSEPRLKPTKMFVAAEQHMLGGWHCHGLLEFPDTKHAPEMVQFQRNNLKSLGYNMVGSVGNLDACSVYLSKYLVKDEFHGDWRMAGRKKFWKSVAPLI
ncbi:hypothetical protein ES705_38904 [subsurface metagenome]